jgi:hypothetical protein
MTWAAFGLLVTDKTEKALGMEPSEKEREELRKVVPRVRVVEKGEAGR